MMSPALLNQFDPLRDPFPINRETKASSPEHVRNIRALLSIGLYQTLRVMVSRVVAVRRASTR